MVNKFWTNENTRLAAKRYCDHHGMDWKKWSDKRIARAIIQEQVENELYVAPRISKLLNNKTLISNGDDWQTTLKADGTPLNRYWDYEDVHVLEKYKKPKDELKKPKERYKSGRIKYNPRKKEIHDTENYEENPFTYRHWKGEHWEDGKWVLREGFWWNPYNMRWEVGEVDPSYFYWYCEFIQPEFPKPKPMGKIHEQWGEEIEEDNLCIELKPRDHYKTTFISIGYSVYNICEQLLYPILIISVAELNTKDTFGAIKKHLDKNERISSFYGSAIDKEQTLTQDKAFIVYQKNLKNPGLFCATFGSKKVMGTHPKLCICDDIEDRPLTPAYMYQAKNMIEKSIIPAIGVDGKLLVVGTIKGFNSSNDIYIYLQKKEIFSFNADPAVYMVNENGEPLLNEDNKIIFDMPKMENVDWSKKKRAKLDAEGNPVWKNI